MRAAFWVLSLGVIAAYLFFFALGAFGFDEVLPLSLAVTALAVLWGVRAALAWRRGGEGRDPRLIQARERRGF